jgi:pimeloyl-ACP methyl ester carboxylesterase
LLHGYPLNRKLWRGRVELWVDAARVIALDLRGQGGSEVPDAPYTID